MDFLYNMGKRYPHAWYARRFFNKVVVSEEPGPHFGMGLDCYVQWSSPIRRITDLQVRSNFSRLAFCCDEYLIFVYCFLSNYAGTCHTKTIFTKETSKRYVKRGYTHPIIFDRNGLGL